jgi:hypothetical protein
MIATMRAFGSDRLVVDGEGRIFLSSRLPKPNWNPRASGASTLRGEHPGTAILCEESWYEIVAVEPLAQGVRYELAPWPEEHVIRTSEAYDEGSEARRLAEHRGGIGQERRRKTVSWLSVVTGHLPAAVQERLASELGADAPKMTMISALPPFALVGAAVFAAVSALLANRPFPMPPLGWILLAYLALESTIRFGNAWLTSRPIGSTLGLILYALYYLLSPRKETLVAPLQPEPGALARPLQVPPEVVVRDAITMRAPLFSLLSAAEQRSLLARYRYDQKGPAVVVAWIVLIGSTIGAVATFHTFLLTGRFGALISAMLAGYLAAEQIWRLSRLSAQPAGSLLGILVRPFLRRYL